MGREACSCIAWVGVLCVRRCADRKDVSPFVITDVSFVWNRVECSKVACALSLAAVVDGVIRSFVGVLRHYLAACLSSPQHSPSPQPCLCCYY